LQLKLATWNIHRCIGQYGVMSQQRCAAVLKEIEADVVALQEVESRPGHARDVLAGDQNEWFLWGCPLRMLHRVFPDTPHRRSWPARAPLFSLDRIWVHPRRAMISLTTHRSTLARVTSDHLPLIAEIGMERI